jgi:ATP-dependent 26S proteasome regulatory subunit
MSNWSKEDKVVYNKSEVFQEYEKRVLENYQKLLDLQKVISKEAQSKVEKATETLGELSKATESANKNLSELNEMIGSVDDENSKEEGEDILVEATQQIIYDLQKIAEEALENKDYDSVYKIERTIQELLDEE